MLFAPDEGGLPESFRLCGCAHLAEGFLWKHLDNADPLFSCATFISLSIFARLNCSAQLGRVKPVRTARRCTCSPYSGGGAGPSKLSSCKTWNWEIIVHGSCRQVLLQSFFMQDGDSFALQIKGPLLDAWSSTAFSILGRPRGPFLQKLSPAYVGVLWTDHLDRKRGGA